MSGKDNEIKNLEKALFESMEANDKSSIMSLQLKEILYIQKDQGAKIDRIHEYFDEDKVRGTKGVLVDVRNLENDVQDLKFFNLVLKKQVLLVSAISSFFVSIIIGVAIFFITKKM